MTVTLENITRADGGDYWMPAFAGMTKKSERPGATPAFPFCAFVYDTVIPGRRQRVRAKRGPMTGFASNPESRDSGFALTRAPE